MPVKVGDIDITHNSWRGDILNRYNALLVGGTVFNNIKGQFLLKKPTEGAMMVRAMPNSGSPGSQVPLAPAYMAAPGATDQYTYRLNKTSYKPIVPSLFGYLAAKLFPEDPIIKTTDEKIISLLTNADELKRPLTLICREALINALTYSVTGSVCGSYLQLYEDDDGIIRFNLMHAMSVIDWEGDNQPEWVRTRTIASQRSIPHGSQDKELWTWKVYTDVEEITYTGLKKAGGPGRPLKIDGPDTKAHEFGVCPFVRINLSEYQYLLDQIAPPIVEQFNLESDIASLCGKISNSQLILKTAQKDLGTIVIPQLGVIIMDPTDDGKFASPDPACCEPLFKYRISLRDSIYNSINSSVMRASADFVQNPRQSATAKAMDLDPWAKWSMTFAQPVKSALSLAMEAIANFYDIAVPEIEWPDPLPISEDGVKGAIDSAVKPPPSAMGAAPATPEESQVEAEPS